MRYKYKKVQVSYAAFPSIRNGLIAYFGNHVTHQENTGQQKCHEHKCAVKFIFPDSDEKIAQREKNCRCKIQRSMKKGQTPTCAENKSDFKGK